MTENDSRDLPAERPPGPDQSSPRPERQAAAVREPAAALPPGRWRIPTCPPEV